MPEYRFDEIAINSKEKKKPTEEDKNTYIGLEHLDAGSLTVSRWGSEIAPTGDKLVMRKGDVLFGKRRAYQKKVAIAPFDGIFSAHGMVLRPREEVITKDFFPLFISSDYYLDAAIKISVGSLSPTINWSDLKELTFTIPTLEEQKKLAPVIWAAIDTKNAYKKLLLGIDELVKSQFIEMFGRADSNSMEWPSCEIKDLYDVRSSKRIYAKELTTSGIPFLKVADVLERINTGKSHPMTYISEKKYRELEESGLVPRTGDILVTSRGTIGKCYILTDNDEFYFQDGMISWLKAKQSCRLLPEFIAALFEEEGFLKALDEATNKTTVTYISLDKLAALKVICPPEDKQRAYLDFITQSDKSKFVDLQATISEMFTCMIKSLSIYGGQSYAE